MMNALIRGISTFYLIYAFLALPIGQAKEVTPAESAQVIGAYFSPPDNAAQAIVEQIGRSRSEVLVQAYGFTHNGIAQALVQAQKRGVKVQVVMDAKSAQTNRFVVDILDREKIAYRWDGKHAIAHNKVMIIDQDVIVTGSFNFTNSAQTRNAENVLILKSPTLAAEYRKNWLEHWAHSRN